MLNKYRLTAIAIFLVIAGSFAWWWIAADEGERQAAALAEALRSKGWSVEQGETSITGAPMRLDFNLKDPALGTAGGWRWSAAEAHIRRLLYRRDFYKIGVLGSQRLETPFGAVDFSAGSAAASLRFGAEEYAADLLSRLSLVLSDVAADGFAASRIEAHLGALPEKTPNTRKLFLGAKGLKFSSAAPAALSLTGLALFDRPLDRSGSGVPEAVAIDFPADAAKQTGATLTIEGEKSASLAFSGRLERAPGSDGLTGWRGKLRFESDKARVIIDWLGAAGLLDATSVAALQARVADSGRLAGVIEIDGDKVTALDIAPQDISLRADF